MELKSLPVLALAFLVEIALFLPAVPQLYHCPKAALIDTCAYLESHEHVVANPFFSILAKSKINSIWEIKIELFHLLA